MDSRRLIKLSKFLALILRHQPERFGLPLDEEGWASFSEVMEILRGLPNFRWATRADVMALVEEGAGDSKRRFEVAEGRIRARYGHSLAQPIRYEPCIPPPLLYHGTAPESLEAIRREGLQPMERQYVHLSPDPETAIRVGARHDDRAAGSDAGHRTPGQCAAHSRYLCAFYRSGHVAECFSRQR